MLKETFVSAIVLMAVFITRSPSQGIPMPEHDRLRSVKGLPFSALVFFEDRDAMRLFLGILMDQDDIGEENLKLLFHVVSEKYPPPETLEVQVYTDLRVPGALANGEIVNVGGSRSVRSVKTPVDVPGGAFYLRRETLELFRYNPKYPEAGMKTVILRGKE
jgi:hypothetical protein